MSRTMDGFVPMTGPARVIYDLLVDYLEAEGTCLHKHPKKCQDSIGHGAGCACPDVDEQDVSTTLSGLEEAANAIAAAIEDGRLS